MSVELTKLPSGINVITEAMPHLAAAIDRKLINKLTEEQMTGSAAFVDGVLLKPLPVPDAGQLVHMYNAYPGAGLADGAGSTGVLH